MKNTALLAFPSVFALSFFAGPTFSAFSHRARILSDVWQKYHRQ